MRPASFAEHHSIGWVKFRRNATRSHHSDLDARSIGSPAADYGGCGGWCKIGRHVEHVYLDDGGHVCLHGRHGLLPTQEADVAEGHTRLLFVDGNMPYELFGAYGNIFVDRFPITTGQRALVFGE